MIQMKKIRVYNIRGNIALSVSNNDIYKSKTEHVCLLSGVAIAITETWYLTECLTIQQTI